MTRPALLAVDGGGSKIDATLVSRAGRVLGAVRVDGSVFDELGSGESPDGEVPGLGAVVRAVAADAGRDPGSLPIADLGVYCVAGADLPSDDRRIVRALRHRRWTTEDVVRNDTFAVLRAGSDRGWGVAVVSGFGMNCSGVSPDGRTVRFPALGSISGDWGGGMDIGRDALWHAVRARDGRGEPTVLVDALPRHFGLRSARAVMEALYFRRLGERRLVELAPVVFRAAGEGDSVARSIVDRQADEVVAMAGAAIRRLRLASEDVDVVLGGGVFRATDGPFFERIERGLRVVADRVRMVVLVEPPVVGAALLGLDLLGVDGRAGARVRAALTHDRLSANTVPASTAPAEEG